MSEEYATFTLFQALSIAQNTKANAVRSISTDTTEIKLNYCIPKTFAKRQTDVSAAESDQQHGPDTGPGIQYVELMFTVDRKSAAQQTILNTLLFWHGLLNTADPFRRGFLGLENEDNPSLNLDPIATLGYKLLSFDSVNPVGNKGTQEYIVVLELQGSTTDLPALNP